MGRYDTDKLNGSGSGTARHFSGADFTHPDTIPAAPLPKLRELRNEVFFWAEYNYLSSLVVVCGHNVQRACQVSGLSRSRLYSLLKKYRIATSFHTPCHQK